MNDYSTVTPLEKKKQEEVPDKQVKWKTMMPHKKIYDPYLNEDEI
jgi:hypothetical protein